MSSQRIFKKEEMNSLIGFLEEFCGGHLLEEKIFVVPSYQVGEDRIITADHAYKIQKYI